jgi:hypothetical protein
MRINHPRTQKLTRTKPHNNILSKRILPQHRYRRQSLRHLLYMCDFPRYRGNDTEMVCAHAQGAGMWSVD